MKIVPINFKTACEFVDQCHRHNAAPPGCKFAIGLKDAGELIGVVIVGRPVNRNLDDGFTIEITRVCVLDGNRNANSMLYGAGCRAAKAMGYRRVITYNLASESGSSLKAAGFRPVSIVPARKGWSCDSRPRSTKKYPAETKIRWEKDL